MPFVMVVSPDVNDLILNSEFMAKLLNQEVIVETLNSQTPDDGGRGACGSANNNIPTTVQSECDGGRIGQVCMDKFVETEEEVNAR